MRKTLMLGALALLVAGAVQAQRDQIRIAGSSTVYPFTTKVAERFGRTTQFKTPVIESTGTGGGFKLFCQGVGLDTTDVSNASRAIKSSEVELCADNGVTDITEIQIGYDGIVVANSVDAPEIQLTRRQIFLALARDVPAAPGQTKSNPYTTWHQIDPSLPDTEIEVLGPPPTSGTRDAFVELVMEEGCQSFAWLEELEDTGEDRYDAICKAIREDGAYVEAGENDNLIVQKLVANPNALGVFGYSFLEENQDRIQGSAIDGVVPTFDTIAEGTYPVSRPLFVYVKKAHVGVVPGLEAFIQEYTSDAAWGSDGYLTDIGLIPLDPSKRTQVAQAARSFADNVD